MHALVKVNLLGIDVAIKMNDANLLVTQVSANPTQGGEANGVVTTKNDWESTTGKDMSYTLGDLIKALLIIGGYCKDITNIT